MMISSINLTFVHAIPFSLRRSDCRGSSSDKCLLKLVSDYYMVSSYAFAIPEL